MTSVDHLTNNAQRRFRVAVIGGGISGLAAAHRLVELAGPTGALDLTLFEAGSRLGGVIHTERTGDYIVELGADSFITNKPAAADLCRRLGIEDRLIGTDPRYRRALVLRGGKPVPIPDGFMLMAPAKIWPVVASPLFSPWGKLRMGLEYFIPPRRADSDDESVASFVRRRLGREALDRLVQPLVAGIYTSDPERLSLRATLPRFIEMEQRHGSLVRAARRQVLEPNEFSNGDAAATESGARYGLFASLRNGLSELANALVRRVEQAGAIRLNAPVTAIRRQAAAADGYALTVGGGGHEEDVNVDAVVIALPAGRAAELIAPLDRSLATALGEIECASSAIVATGHALADVRHPLNGSGLVVPAIEQRKILSVSFASRKFAGRAPDGKVVLRTFLGGALQPEVLAADDASLIQTVLSELRDILGVGGTPDFTIVSRHDRSMPQYHVGHIERVQQINRLAQAHPRLALAGNAYHGVGIPDCVSSGQQAAERAVGAALVALHRV